MKIDKETAFCKALFSYEPKEREAVIKAADLGMDYVHKQTYVKGGNPIFRFGNALKLDKSSKGAFNVFLHGEGGQDMDLMYLRKVVNREIRARREAKRRSQPETTKDVLTTTP